MGDTCKHILWGKRSASQAMWEPTQTKSQSDLLHAWNILMSINLPAIEQALSMQSY
jgi:hypothetical protein